MSDIIYKSESFKIIGLCMEVHNYLGKGLLEVVYKDALEYEFENAGIPFEREKEYLVNYKNVILPHRFYADFVVYDKIILEVKAVPGIEKNFITQSINYLCLSKNKLALLVNFGGPKLTYKRILN